jgi:hypothetical protein
MPTLPGRCVNTANCTAAASGELVRAPANGRYACPYCGKTLVPPTTKLRRSTRGRQLLRDMGESSGTILGLSGLIGGVLLGGLLLYRAPVVGLSRHSLRATPIVNVTPLSQPEALTNEAAARRRRHVVANGLLHRVALAAQTVGGNRKALQRAY